jgi:hypothetical protein
MPTIIRSLPVAYPDAAALSPISVPTIEQQLFENPLIANWWRADAGFDSTGWRCRKTNAKLVKARSAMPSRVNSAAYGGKPVLQFAAAGAASGELYDGGLNLLPVNADFSVIFVGRQGPSNDVGYMWGNGVVPSTAGGGGVGLQLGAGGSFNGTVLTMSGTNLVSTGGTPPVTNAGGPYIHIASFDDAGASAGTAVQMISPANFTQTNSAVSASLHVTNGEFHVGGAGPTGTTPSNSYFIEGGDVAEVIILSTAIAAAGNATLLSAIRGYLGALYGLTTP